VRIAEIFKPIQLLLQISSLRLILTITSLTRNGLLLQSLVYLVEISSSQQSGFTNARVPMLLLKHMRNIRVILSIIARHQKTVESEHVGVERITLAHFVLWKSQSRVSQELRTLDSTTPKHLAPAKMTRTITAIQLKVSNPVSK
jgi:hypothetical protein